MRTPLLTSSALVLATALAVAGCSSSKSKGSTAGGNSSPSSSSPSSSGAATTSSTAAIRLSGNHLVGPDGKTLYYNTVDTAANIQCTGQCASIWPPLLGTPKPGAGLDAGDFKTVKRPDGSMQVTFYGHPLYEFGSDTGDTQKGAGIADSGGKWLVAPKEPPAAAPSSSESMSHSSSSPGYAPGY